MGSDHQVRRKWSGDASKKVQLFKVGGSRIIGTAVKHTKMTRSCRQEGLHTCNLEFILPPFLSSEVFEGISLYTLRVSLETISISTLKNAQLY